MDCIKIMKLECGVGSLCMFLVEPRRVCETIDFTLLYIYYICFTLLSIYLQSPAESLAEIP